MILTLVVGVVRRPALPGALDLGPVPFDSVREAPDTVCLEEAGDPRRETRNRAPERWYEYSWLTHVLKPKPG